MTTNSITSPACFGVVCPLHSRCARYAAVILSEADPYTLGTCLDGKSFPLFVELDTVEAVASSAATTGPITRLTQVLGNLLHNAHWSRRADRPSWR